MTVPRWRFDSALNLNLHSEFHISFDKRDNLVVVLPKQDKVLVYATNNGGVLLHEVAAGQHSFPYTCVVDSIDRFFVSEIRDKCVSLFVDDVLDKTFEGGMTLALSPAGDVLYVHSCAPPYPVKIFDTSDGSLLKVVDIENDFVPCGMATLSTGDIVVASAMNRKIHIVTRDGDILRTIEDDELHKPASVAVDALDNVYVTDRTSDTVAAFSSNGKLINRFRSIFFYQSGSPRNVAVASSGLVAVSYGDSNPVLLFVRE